MSSRIQEIEDFGLSLTFNTIEETTDLIPSTKKSWKTSLIYKHCCMPILKERLKKLKQKWIWYKYCLKYTA